MAKAAQPKDRTNPDEIPLRVPKHGRGALRVGGTNPGAGRPPDAFRELCQGLASKDDTIKVVERVLKDDEHPAWLGALKWATEHGYGKPTQQVEVSGEVGSYVAEVPAKQDRSEWTSSNRRRP